MKRKAASAYRNTAYRRRDNREMQAGECLDEYYLGTGTLTENTNYINMCRTQVRIKMNAPAEYFLRNPLGNHHIMLHGNYELMLDEFLQSNGCKRIE